MINLEENTGVALCVFFEYKMRIIGTFSVEPPRYQEVVSEVLREIAMLLSAHTPLSLYHELTVL